MKHLWLWIAGGLAAALYFLRESPVLAGLDPFSTPAPPLGNYPTNTTSVSTGITGPMASAYRPIMMSPNAPPGDVIALPPPPPIPPNPMAAPAMGGAGWSVSPTYGPANASVAAILAALPLQTVTTPTTETRTGAGHF